MPHATIRAAEPRDALVVAALHLQAEREWGASIPPGFLDTLARDWLGDRARRTWIAEGAGHSPLGCIHGSVIHKLPSPRRSTQTWMHVGFLFVTASARGAGLGERLVTTVVDWATLHEVELLRLNAVEAARSLYTRAGFGPPSAGMMELRLHPKESPDEH